MKKIIALAFLFATAAVAQRPACTSSNLNASYTDTVNNVQYLCTTAGWKPNVGIGAPTVACSAVNYGATYTDVSSGTAYHCGTTGWVASGGGGGSGSGGNYAYTFSVSGGTITQINNVTGATTTGTDLGAMLNTLMAANVSTGATLYFRQGVYPIKSVTQETACGNYYYGIGIPTSGRTFDQWVTWRFIGDAPNVWIGEGSDSAINTQGVVWALQSSAYTGVSSSNEVMAEFYRPATNCNLTPTNTSNNLMFDGITITVPDNQRGNLSAAVNWFANTVNYKNFHVEVALPQSTLISAAPVAGSIGSWGVTTSVSGAGNTESFGNVTTTGFDTGYDMLAEHVSCQDSVSAIYDNTGFVFGRSGIIQVSHPSYCHSITSQENLTDIAFGSNMAQGTLVDIPELDVELGTDTNWYSHFTAAPFAIITEANDGYTYGRISIGTINAGTGVNLLGNVFTLGGSNFTTDTYIASRGVTQKASADNFQRANGGLGAHWTAIKNTPTISSHIVVGSVNSADNDSFFTEYTSTGPQFCQVMFSNTTGNSTGAGCWVYGSSSAPAENGYLINEGTQAGTTSSHFILYKAVSGSYSTLYTEAGNPGGTNDVIRLEAVPNVSGSSVALNIYRNGVIITSVTDSSSPFTSGSPGIDIYSNTLSGISQFTGGSFKRTMP